MLVKFQTVDCENWCNWILGTRVQVLGFQLLAKGALLIVRPQSLQNDRKWYSSNKETFILPIKNILYIHLQWWWKYFLQRYICTKFWIWSFVHRKGDLKRDYSLSVRFIGHSKRKRWNSEVVVATLSHLICVKVLFCCCLQIATVTCKLFVTVLMQYCKEYQQLNSALSNGFLQQDYTS